MVHEIWYIVYDIWYMVRGMWYMEYGIWYMVYGKWVGVLEGTSSRPTAEAASCTSCIRAWGLIRKPLLFFWKCIWGEPGSLDRASLNSENGFVEQSQTLVHKRGFCFFVETHRWGCAVILLRLGLKFTGKWFQFRNFMVMKFTTRMLYHDKWRSCCVVNFIAIKIKLEVFSYKIGGMGFGVLSVGFGA